MKSMNNFIAGLKILSSFYDEGLETWCFMEAEHDIIYFHITSEQIPADSPDGELLTELGFVTDSNIDVWVWYT